MYIKVAELEAVCSATLGVGDRLNTETSADLTNELLDVL